MSEQSETLDRLLEETGLTALPSRGGGYGIYREEEGCALTRLADSRTRKEAISWLEGYCARGMEYKEEGDL